MDLSAFIIAGFLGLAPGGFGGAGPIPGGAPTYGDVNTFGVWSQPDKPQVSSGPIIFIPIHKPSHFSFVTIVKDDGKDPAGGWQAAKANLPFAQTTFPIGLKTWYCPITIGMPIRHRTRGYISPDAAATKSAAVTNNGASNTDFNLPYGIFCDQFRDNVKAAFKTMYPGLGQTVGR